MCSIKKLFLKYLQESTCLGSLFNKVYKYCEIFKSTYFKDHLRMWITLCQPIRVWTELIKGGHYLIFLETFIKWVWEKNQIK